MMENLMLDSVVLGGFGGALYLYMTYTIYHILKNMSEGTDTALTKLFIDQGARKAFKVLAVSTLAISIIFTGRMILLVTGNDIRPSPLILILPVPLAGIAYFFHRIKKITDDR